MNLEEIRQYRSLDLLAKQVVEGFITGMHKSPYHGFSVEFAEHKLYNPGESIKNIDWRLYGRTERLYVKKFEEETNLRCQIVLDHSSSMFFPEDKHDKIKFAAYAAAALMYLLKQQRDAFGLTVFGEKIEYQSDVKSSLSHFNMLLNQLNKYIELKPENKSTDVASTLHEVANKIHRRSLIIIFSDMFEPGENTKELFSALQHLKYKKHEVILFHVVDKSLEIDFEYGNKPYRFVDLETKEEVKLYPNEVKESYLTQVKKFKNELRNRCENYKIDYIEADVNKDFSQVLLPFLLKRQKLK
jgi:uncharacterized protein (DUF58 family)